MFIFQSTINNTYKDHQTMDEARKAVEDAGSGTIVKFIREPNLPGCLPRHVDRSCAMWVLDGAWYSIAIFSSHGGRFAAQW